MWFVSVVGFETKITVDWLTKSMPQNKRLQPYIVNGMTSIERCHDLSPLDQNGNSIADKSDRLKAVVLTSNATKKMPAPSHR